MTSINKIMDQISHENAEKIKKTMLSFDSVLGIMEHEKIEISDEIKAMVKEREEARKNKDWTKSDEIRDKLKEKGFVVEDSKEGPRIKKI